MDGRLNLPVADAGPLRVLIVRLSALGDTALTLPLAYLLKQQLPDLHLGWVVGERAASLLRGLDCIDRLHILPQSGAGAAGLYRLLREIRGQNYRLALDPQGITRSAIVPWLARIPQRVGFVPGPLESRELAPLFLNHFVRVPPGVEHVTDRILYLATVLGIEKPRQPPCPLFLEPAAVYSVAGWWQQQGLNQNTLIMGVGAGWPTKIWPAERVRCLAQAAAGQGFRTVLLWGPAERRRLDAWHEFFHDVALLAPPTNIPEMIALLHHARGYAGPDSAPLHLAWLLGKPSFSWFGASDPARCAPRGPGHVQVVRGPHNWRRTALLGNPLTGLAAEQVLPSFQSWLESLDGTGNPN